MILRSNFISGNTPNFQLNLGFEVAIKNKTLKIKLLLLQHLYDLILFAIYSSNYAQHFVSSICWYMTFV